MNQFIINGSVADAPFSQEDCFQNLVDHIHTNYVNEISLISSLRVNGIEISEADENALSSLPLAELETVEVTLVHPKELAEDTLQTLIIFTQQLAELSRGIARALETGQELNGEFTKLVDGIETVVESVTTVRAMQDMGYTNLSIALEADLTTILRNLSDACDLENDAGRIQILAEELPRNLEAWKSRGIPEMIRSRDS